MKILFLILISILIPTPELVVYTNDNFHFEVQFPRGYQEESKTSEEKFGTIEYVKLSGQEMIEDGQAKGNVVYSVVASRYQTNEAFKKSGMKLQELVYNHSKHVNQEWFLNNNYIILSEKHTKDFLFYIVGDASTDLITHKKVLIRNDMSYSMSITNRGGLLTREYINAFFKSMKIKTK